MRLPQPYRTVHPLSIWNALIEWSLNFIRAGTSWVCTQPARGLGQRRYSRTVRWMNARINEHYVSTFLPYKKALVEPVITTFIRKSQSNRRDTSLNVEKIPTQKTHGWRMHYLWQDKIITTHKSERKASYFVFSVKQWTVTSNAPSRKAHAVCITAPTAPLHWWGNQGIPMHITKSG